MTNNNDCNTLLGKDERISHYAETDIRYFQVKDGNRYQILVQANSEDDKPSVPQRYDISGLKTKPVVRGSKWCLERCVGVIQFSKTSYTFPDSDYDFVEVTVNDNAKVYQQII